MSIATMTRIDRLELLVLGDDNNCPICREWNDLRFMTSDSETGVMTGESRPVECPRCGRIPTGTLEIVGMSLDELP